MSHQLTFNLPVRTALEREDFFVSPTNTNALNALDNPENWPLGKMVICGEAGSGKTHLAHVWAAQTGAKIIEASGLTTSNIQELALGPVAVEDADLIAGNIEEETLLFHLHNLSQSFGNALLLTAKKPPSRWPFALPDLRSRMEGTAVVQIDAPDEMLLTVVMLKHFSDRQLLVAPEVIDYIIKRVPRSLGFIRDLCITLDKAALSEKRAITRPLAAKVLNALDKNPPKSA